MTHPNQAQPRRRLVSQAPRKPGPVYQSHLSFATRRRRPTGKVRFVPDPSRLSGVLPPGARVRRPARRAVRMSGTERIANYAGQDLAASGGRAVKTVLTPARRRRVAHRGKMTAFDRAEL